jgi:hypothetical protein
VTRVPDLAAQTMEYTLVLAESARETWRRWLSTKVKGKSLRNYRGLLKSGTKVASSLKYWNDTDICNITATCLSYVLYRRLDTCEPAFRKPQLIWRLLPPTFVRGGEFVVKLSNGDIYWSRGQPNCNG